MQKKTSYEPPVSGAFKMKMDTPLMGASSVSGEDFATVTNHESETDFWD